MSETRYPLNGDRNVHFSYDDYRYGCLCTFPFNNIEREIGIGTVESLALLGAALCLSVNGGLEDRDYFMGESYQLPDCIPQWIRDGIRKAVVDYPEKFDSGEYDLDHLPNAVTDEEIHTMEIKRLEDIKRWCDKEISDIKNETL